MEAISIGTAEAVPFQIHFFTTVRLPCHPPCLTGATQSREFIIGSMCREFLFFARRGVP
jgi:hypothetical protein